VGSKKREGGGGGINGGYKQKVGGRMRGMKVLGKWKREEA